MAVRCRVNGFASLSIADQTVAAPPPKKCASSDSAALVGACVAPGPRPSVGIASYRVWAEVGCFSASSRFACRRCTVPASRVFSAWSCVSRGRENQDRTCCPPVIPFTFDMNVELQTSSRLCSKGIASGDHRERSRRGALALEERERRSEIIAMGEANPHWRARRTRNHEETRRPSRGSKAASRRRLPPRRPNRAVAIAGFEAEADLRNVYSQQHQNRYSGPVIFPDTRFFCRSIHGGRERDDLGPACGCFRGRLRRLTASKTATWRSTPWFEAAETSTRFFVSRRRRGKGDVLSKQGTRPQ